MVNDDWKLSDYIANKLTKKVRNYLVTITMASNALGNEVAETLNQAAQNDVVGSTDSSSFYFTDKPR